IPQEYRRITCQSIDIVVPHADEAQMAGLIDQLLAEFAAKPSEPVVAYRGGDRWMQTFEPVRLDEPVLGAPRLRESGVYLIAGGLGGIGLALAEYLVRVARAKLILLGRSALPERSEWEQWLATHGAQDATSGKIRKVRGLEESGGEVLVV